VCSRPSLYHLAHGAHATLIASRRGSISTRRVSRLPLLLPAALQKHQVSRQKPPLLHHSSPETQLQVFLTSNVARMNAKLTQLPEQPPPPRHPRSNSIIPTHLTGQRQKRRNSSLIHIIRYVQSPFKHQCLQSLCDAFSSRSREEENGMS